MNWWCVANAALYIVNEEYTRILRLSNFRVIGDIWFGYDVLCNDIAQLGHPVPVNSEVGWGCIE